MSDSSTIPSAAALVDRYSTARVLRTRATGTPFRVRSDRSRLIVTTVSGSDRDVSFKEIVVCWPHMERAAPRNAWKQLSNNGSYLESIYDDLRGTGVDVQSPPTAPAMVPVELGPRVVVPRDEPVRELERMRADLVRHEKELLAAQTVARATQVTNEELQIRESRLHREVALRRSEEDRLKTELAGAVQELTRLREASRNARHEAARSGQDGTAAEIASLRATNLSLVTDLATARRLLGEARKVAAEVEPLRAEVEPLREVKAKAARQATDARRKLEAANVALTDAQREAGEAKRSLEREQKARRAAEAAAAAASAAAVPTTVEVLIDAGRLRFAKNYVVDRSASAHLASAASQIFSNPNAAVADCRRALERSIELLWTSATGRTRDKLVTMGMMLSDLYDHPSFPAPDFHLAKNLYARASGVVHEGGAEADAALWIWLGVVQIAELLSVATTEADGGLDGGRPAGAPALNSP